jgi:choline dehydrogenase
MNYFGHSHDLKVMVAVLRRALEIVAHWPAHRKIGSLMVPPVLAQKHGYQEGATPSDALLEDFALHFSLTVYHRSCTCRIGSVVDPRLRVVGIGKLRVADASVTPNVVSGNTNAASIMIGEKAAELVAADHGVKLAEFVGKHPHKLPLMLGPSESLTSHAGRVTSFLDSEPGCSLTKKSSRARVGGYRKVVRW